MTRQKGLHWFRFSYRFYIKNSTFVLLYQNRLLKQNFSYERDLSLYTVANMHENFKLKVWWKVEII